VSTPNVDGKEKKINNCQGKSQIHTITVIRKEISTGTKKKRGEKLQRKIWGKNKKRGLKRKSIVKKKKTTHHNKLGVFVGGGKGKPNSQSPSKGGPMKRERGALNPNPRSRRGTCNSTPWCNIKAGGCSGSKKVGGKGTFKPGGNKTKKKKKERKTVSDQGGF